MSLTAIPTPDPFQMAKQHFNVATEYMRKIKEIDCIEGLSKLKHNGAVLEQNHTLDRLGFSIAAFRQAVAGCIHAFHILELPTSLQAYISTIGNICGLYDIQTIEHSISIFNSKQIQLIQSNLDHILNYYKHSSRPKLDFLSAAGALETLWANVLMFTRIFEQQKQRRFEQCGAHSPTD